MSYIIFSVIGALGLIGIRWLRSEGSSRWHALSWLVWILAGLALVATPELLYVIALLIPLATRLSIKAWFGLRVQWSSELGALGLITIVSMLYSFFFASAWLLGVYFLVETYFTFTLIRKSFHRRGIVWLSNSGRSILWMKWHYVVNLLLGTVILLGIALPGNDLLNGFVQLVFLFGGIISVFHHSSKQAFEPVFQDPKYLKSTVDQSDRFRISNALNLQISKEKYHLSSEASLKSLAKNVDATPHQLSQVLNESEGMTFFEFLAYHRVQTAKGLLQSRQFSHYKIEQIAEEVGYLSKSSFNTSFKKITGLTPSEYRDRSVRDAKLERLEHREIDVEKQSDSTFEQIKNSTIMLSNFLKIYRRNLSKNWLFSGINLAGLTIGFASCLLIYLYLGQELSYDKFHPGYENIYRITFETNNPQTRTPHPMAGQLALDFPEVESAVTLTPLYGPGLTLQSVYLQNPENNIMLRVPDGYAADTSFFRVFDFELLAGNRETALNDIGSVVITESLAEQFFGDEDPMGKRIEGAADGGFGIVSAVMKDAPANSHFHPKFIISYNTLRADPGNEGWMSWGDPGHFNYIRLRQGADVTKLESAIPEWVAGYGDAMPPELLQFIKDGDVRFGLQPIADIHLTSDLRWELEANSSYMYVYILMGAMIFILVIITVNFVNLYTARTYERSKEVGIRKTLGASEGMLILQFIAESIMTCLLSMLAALSLAALLLPNFNALSGKQLSLNSLVAVDVLSYALGLVLIIGLIGGFFPSINLSKVKPSAILKGGFSLSKGSNWKRSILIGTQFAVSACMIFGSLVILDQIQFLEVKPLGINDDHLVVMEIHTDDEVRSIEAIKSELLKNPGVMEVGGISNLPGGQFNQNDLFLESNSFERIGTSELWVDFDALQVLGLSLASGRWFDRSSQLDSAGANFIINQAAADQLSIEQSGSQVVWGMESGPIKGTVVGIMEDFNFKSLHEPIRPLVVTVGLGAVNYLLIRIANQNVSETLSWIDEVHRQFDAQFAADVWFLDDQLGRLYDAERRAFSVFNLFAIIALFLASIGLLGIAYLTIAQRKKEIGIRKVLGARIIELLVLENKPFLQVLLFALAVGMPLAFFIMNEWLSAFAYHISIGLSPFLFTGLVLIAVALTSVSFAVLRTVLQNPSDSLRSE
ncbi:MAG: ABC transporter permease [Cyclobacteriaceae bacterium]